MATDVSRVVCYNCGDGLYMWLIKTGRRNGTWYRYQKFSAMQTFRCSRSLFPENRSSERESEKLKRKVRTCYPKVRRGRRVIEVILVRMGHFCLVSKRS